jgi:uncharacterized protein YceK
MRRRVATCLAVVLSGILGGCGTSLNLDGDSRIYGGIQLDAQHCSEGLAKAAGNTRQQEPDQTPLWHLAQSAGALVDLPLSLVMDTLTLPITIATTMEERNDQEPAASQTVVTIEKPPKPRDSASAPGR